MVTFRRQSWQILDTSSHLISACRGFNNQLSPVEYETQHQKRLAGVWGTGGDSVDNSFFYREGQLLCVPWYLPSGASP